MGILDWMKEGALTALSDWAGGTNDEDHDASTNPGRVRYYTNHAGGYYTCSHTGCKKKADSFITNHDCCGRCGMGRTCKQESMADYDGPGGFAHRASPPSPAAIQIGTATPGICTVCHEPLEDHPGYEW